MHAKLKVKIVKRELALRRRGEGGDRVREAGARGGELGSISEGEKRRALL